MKQILVESLRGTSASRLALSLSAVVIVAVMLGGAVSARQVRALEPRIVFVCEHGAAKSVIATAYFNKLAEERGLPYRATFRGTSPQEALSASAVEGLRSDGVPVPSGKPAAIAAGDVARATHIFAIGCTLPAAAVSSGKSADWTDVPEGKGYAATRDAIVAHVKQLLDDLQRKSK
jgi:protein-tyrosine-phosphatase